jgi:hypothetical protein
MVTDFRSKWINGYWLSVEKWVNATQRPSVTFQKSAFLYFTTEDLKTRLSALTHAVSHSYKVPILLFRNCPVIFSRIISCQYIVSFFHLSVHLIYGLPIQRLPVVAHCIWYVHNTQTRICSSILFGCPLPLRRFIFYSLLLPFVFCSIFRIFIKHVLCTKHNCSVASKLPQTVRLVLLNFVRLTVEANAFIYISLFCFCVHLFSIKLRQILFPFLTN